MRTLLPKLVLVAVTAAFCLGVLELAARVIVNPVDFLRPELVPDAMLRHRVEPHSAGHDAWGFRNLQVPESAEIVAIGDSQTYGNAAAARYSWPAWLEELSGRSVYNMGLGGYGPYEYLHLLQSKALTLSPAQVVIGLYLGNDLADAERAVYAVDQWSKLRTRGASPPAETAAAGASVSPSPLTRIREWLRGRSVLYRWATLSLGHWVRPFQVRYLAKAGDEQVILSDEDGTLVTSFQPAYRHRGMDLEDPRIEEGLQLSLRALSEIDRICRENQVELLVLLIPTKVSVFAERAQSLGASAGQQATIDRLVADERRARSRLVQHLEDAGITYVEVQETLAAHADQGIYPRTVDGHPTRDGYRLIAEAVHEALASGPG